MTRFSIYQLERLNPNSNITCIRIWEDDEQKFLGMMDKCPKEYLHKPICEWAVGEWEMIFYF